MVEKHQHVAQEPTHNTFVYNFDANPIYPMQAAENQPE